MSYTNDPIYHEISIELTEEFQELYEANWEDYEEDWDDFKDEALEVLYDITDREVEQDYNKLMFYLRVIKEYYDQYGGDFKHYNDPQQIVNVAYYIISKSVFNEFQQEAFDYGNEEADQELFSIFGE